MGVKIESTSLDWRSIIYREIESEELDYKAAQDWGKLDRVGKSKFVRHCIAMANTKGGYIVVGVGEDKTGRPRLYTGLTEHQAKSFDPTAVGNFINRYADPAIDFDIERPVVDNKCFVVFVIRRFKTLPHVCAYNIERSLQQGVFYIRTAEASSRPAFRASEMHGIMQRALRNQREVLGRMLRGVLYENRQYFNPDEGGFFAEQIKNSREFFAGRRKELAWNDGNSNALLEITASPSEFKQENFTLSEVRQAVDSSSYMFPGAPFQLIGQLDDSYFTNVALRDFSESERSLFQVFKSGLFHYMRLMEKPDMSLDYTILIKVISEAVHFIGQYFSELGYDDELLDIRFKLKEVEETMLTGVDSQLEGVFMCRIPEIKVKIQRSVADFASAPVEHSIDIIKEICERFNLSDGRHHNLESTIREFLEKRYMCS